VSEVDRTHQWLKTFERFAMQYFASDDDAHRKAQHEAVVGMVGVVRELEAMQPNQRTALARFFDHPVVEAQVMAAVYLARIMPERALPVLEKIRAEYRGLSVGLTAFNTLFAYEHGDLTI
jgi:hypothetical protein